MEDNLPAVETLTIPPAEPDPAVARERDAYLRLYHHLKEKYTGHYVAIYGGELVDHDLGEAALFARIDAQYPDEFVWITQVTDTAEREIHLYSARFEPETP